jgi:hypothetical protein
VSRDEAGAFQGVAPAFAAAIRCETGREWSPDPPIDGIRLCRIYTMYCFVETRLFTRLVQQYLTDAEYGALQDSGGDRGWRRTGETWVVRSCRDSGS